LEESYEVGNDARAESACDQKGPDSDVEIAQIYIASGIGETYSVRASVGQGGTIEYAVVDDYGEEFEASPSDSDSPLTMRDLIGLIDSVDLGDDDMWGGGWTDALRNGNLEHGGDPADYLHFVQVSSAFYPELSAYYDSEALAWLESRTRAAKEAEEEREREVFEKAESVRTASPLNPLSLDFHRTVESLSDVERAGIARWLRENCGYAEATVSWQPARPPQWFRQIYRPSVFEAKVRPVGETEYLTARHEGPDKGVVLPGPSVRAFFGTLIGGDVRPDQ
jgi:hypothetical protein